MRRCNGRQQRTTERKVCISALRFAKISKQNEDVITNKAPELMQFTAVYISGFEAIQIAVYYTVYSN